DASGRRARVQQNTASVRAGRGDRAGASGKRSRQRRSCKCEYGGRGARTAWSPGCQPARNIACRDRARAQEGGDWPSLERNTQVVAQSSPIMNKSRVALLWIAFGLACGALLLQARHLSQTRDDSLSRQRMLNQDRKSVV